MNQDASKEIPVKARLRSGSCLTAQQIEDLGLYAIAPDSRSSDGGATVAISSEKNNLAQLDNDGKLQVNSVRAFGASQTHLATDSNGLTFTGWASDIDPTGDWCALMLWPVYSPTESGVKAKNEAGTGTASIRPSLEITEVTSKQIKCIVRNLSSDCTVYLRLIQSPIPPQQA